LFLGRIDNMNSFWTVVAGALLAIVARPFIARFGVPV